MSKGSEIHKRFGLKFAVAYRVRKVRKKYARILESKPFVQSIQMLHLIFTLKDSKKFEIYLLLRKYHCLIINSKHLEFIALYYQEILQWLESDEFKQTYLDTNHPYPPLLNPKRLHKDSKNPYAMKDSNILESIDTNPAKDTHNKKIESHNPNKNTLSHTPTHHLILSYENIPAELAWEMNVPLVWGYNGIWLYNSCAGGEATETFFHHCEGIEFYTVCWKFGDYKSAYIDLYQHYLQGKNILFSFNAWQKGAEKFAHLLDKKVPIFSVTRDYISRLKTGVNHISGTEPITDKFKNLSLNSEIIFPQIHYRGAYKMKPDIDILQTLDNFSLQWGDLGGLGLKLDWLKDATSDVHFIPIDKISGDKAFHTFVNLSKKLHFNVPNNPKAFSGKVNRYEGLLMLPCTLRANTKDIDKNAQETQIEILITTHQLTPNNDHKLTDMTNFIGIDTPQKNLVLYIKQEEFRILTENKLLFDAVQSYFQRYFHALQSYIENLKNNLFNEQDILNYLKNNPQLALAFKKQIQEDITLIKSHRSDIIESWKYYQEFERICKELEENDTH